MTGMSVKSRELAAASVTGLAKFSLILIIAIVVVVLIGDTG